MNDGTAHGVLVTLALRHMLNNWKPLFDTTMRNGLYLELELSGIPEFGLHFLSPS